MLEKVLTDIFILLLFFILFKKIKIEKKHSLLLSVNESLSIKGALAISVIMHHISHKFLFDGGIVVYSFYSVGYLLCFLFFFLSGYGIAKKIEDKKIVVKKIFINKIPKLILISIVATLLNWLINDSIFSMNIGEIKNGSIYPCFYWYLLVYIAEYILLSITLIITKKRKNTILLNYFLTIILIVILKKFGFEEFFYNSVLTFPLGMLVSNNESIIIKKLNKDRVYVMSLLISCLIFIFAFILGRNFSTVFVLTIIKTYTFTIIFILIIYKISFEQNGILRFFGKISFELYEIHKIFIYFILRECNTMSYLFILLLTFLLSILFSYAIKILIDRVLNRNIIRCVIPKQ